jgi:alpha-glucosidase (family GH31 glycosyl hydrolase)/putative sterol carrier protein
MTQSNKIYTQRFPIHFKPLADPKAMVTESEARFTVLTSRLIRLEYSLTGRFMDRPSQVFWYREQPVPEFQVRRPDDGIEVETAHLRLTHKPSTEGFSPDNLSILIKEMDHTWHYGDTDASNLMGTARTLDQADGAVNLEPGLLSREGWSIVDDAQRLVFDDRGWLTQRDDPPGTQDLYFFGYGHDYAACLADYSRVAGPVPLLPRWALGNWWSRYWAYSADELLQLMDGFQQRDVPLAVCIVDMDWHITQTGNRSSGWTGYTWNRDLFPDPEGFLAELHARGLKTALNLHPALGVYPHEAQYREMAERMGLDPATEEPVPFDIADPHFTEAYFELLHHPQEARGVDFWWMDWQQGTESTIAGLDPLWWLNHLHFFDLGRGDEKRPFIFSRWGGLGNHRYPIGFSGDTFVSWESLSFQPFFTATAANVAYGWWSHDIGGHQGGVEEAELFARWVQFGVFSPIFRLHATKNPFHERRPWGYDAETLRVTREAMQLRHALIPYLYTMSWLNHTRSIPPVRPMYHTHPDSEAAYHCTDQYWFGSEMIAAPVVSPADADTGLARQVVWLPPGQWFGLFDGLPYSGDGWQVVYCELGDMPVFAKTGAIIPLGFRPGWGGVENPTSLEIRIFPGADNRFELYEDDGGSSYSIIPLQLRWEDQRAVFEIGVAQGETNHLPEQRQYTLVFQNVVPASIKVALNDQETGPESRYDQGAAVLHVGPVTLSPQDRLSVTLLKQERPLLAERDPRYQQCRKLIRTSRLNTNVKRILGEQLQEILAEPALLSAFELSLPDSVNRALYEIVTGAGVHESSDPRDGSQRVWMWNNAGREDVRYRFAAAPFLGVRDSKRGGRLPKFGVLKASGDQLNLSFGRGPGRSETVEDWLDSLAEGFQPEWIGGLRATLQFTFTGADPYEAYVRLSRGGLTVHPGSHAEPDLAIEADSGHWLALVNGEADPVESFLSGKFQVSGDMDLLMQLANLLGDAPDRLSFRADRWKLNVDYVDAYSLVLGAAQSS